MRRRFDDNKAFEYAISYPALYDSMVSCANGVKWKDSTLFYINHALEKITHLRRLLLNRTYRMMTPIEFTIYEPKERHIQSVHFQDRVFQKSLCDNVIYPAIVPTFIYDNAASLNGKGYTFSLQRLEQHLHSYYMNHGTEGYVLKCDISKYFDSIDHSILYDILCTYFSHSDVLFYLRDSLNKYGMNDVGIGLGSQINQLMALLYLNGMDHFIKEQLRIKYYARYMDDFYIIHHDKEYIKECKYRISEYVSDNLNLSLSDKKTQIYLVKNGFTFIGFRHAITDSGKIYLKLLQDSIQRMKKKLRRMQRLYLQNRISIHDIKISYQSWRAHAMRGDSHKIVRMMDDLFYNLFKIPFESIE